MDEEKKKHAQELLDRYEKASSLLANLNASVRLTLRGMLSRDAQQVETIKRLKRRVEELEEKYAESQERIKTATERVKTFSDALKDLNDRIARSNG